MDQEEHPGQSHQFLEVELGDLTSLGENQVHIKQLKDGSEGATAGKEIVDDAQITDQRYKLVMVGRKLTEEDLENLPALQVEGMGEQQHMLSSQIFHESSEQFSEDIVKNEGLLRYYSRHLHMVFGMFIGIAALIKVYAYQYELLLYLEDYQDLVYFDYVKKMGCQNTRVKAEDLQRMSGAEFWSAMRQGSSRGAHPDVQHLLTSIYKTDPYSVEGRSS